MKLVGQRELLIADHKTLFRLFISPLPPSSQRAVLLQFLLHGVKTSQGKHLRVCETTTTAMTTAMMTAMTTAITTKTREGLIILFSFEIYHVRKNSQTKIADL